MNFDVYNHRRGRQRARGLLALALIADASTATELEEVRVTAQRNLLGQELLLATDARSLTGEQQVSLNRSVADWIERLPGVSLNGQGGLLQAYSVRGFSRWRIRTEVDGVPIITDRRAGNSAAFIPPDLLGVATVQGGPGSSLYGSGAMGGVVSLTSANPNGLAVSASGQTNDNQSSLSLASGKDGVYGAAISYRHANRASDARGDSLNTGFEQLAGLVKLQQDIGAGALSLSWLPSYAKDIGKSSSAYPERQVSDYPEELHSIARVQLVADDAWLLSFYHHYQDWDSRTERIGQRSNLTRYQSHTLGSLFYQSLDYLSGTGRWGMEWVGRRGVSIDDKEFDPQGELVLSQSQIDGDQDNIAVFLDHQWAVDRLRFGGGLRYDYVDQSQRQQSRSDSRLNASANGDWALNDRWMLSAGLGTGFRFPSLTELYFNGVTPRGDTLGNPQLEPETNKAVQFGLRFSGDTVRVTADAYYNQLEDYIERYRVAADLLSYRNLDDAEIWGYELEMAWQLSAQWSHQLSYQWQRGEDGQGNWLADLNPPGWRYLLDWQGQEVGVRSDLSYRESRGDYGEGEQSLPSALIWNASLNRNWADAWQGEVYINNILDRQYLGSADEDAPFQPGRTIGLRIQWTYR